MARNEVALAAIFDQYAPRLYKYAVRLCDEPTVADQIVGDAFTQLLAEFPKELSSRLL